MVLSLLNITFFGDCYPDCTSEASTSGKNLYMAPSCVENGLLEADKHKSSLKRDSLV